MGGKFEPKPGQIDYTHAEQAPVINCVVKWGEKILVVRRSSQMNFYPGLWNGISGFLDDGRSVEEKAKEELQEELNMSERSIINIEGGQSFEQKDPQYGKTWIVYPVLVTVSTDTIVPNWEIEEYKWIEPEEVRTLQTVPGFDRVVTEALKNL